jgi:hypothetical protein
MQDRSNIQKPWVELGQITKSVGGWIIKDLLVRWNETQVTKDGQTDMGAGEQTEFVYDAYRFDYPLPAEVQPGQEAVEYYLEQAKTAIIQTAQDLVAQEAGFLDTN